jgi:MFS family permease
MISAVNGLAPILAPVGGGVMLKFTNWLGIFVFLLFLGVLFHPIKIQPDKKSYFPKHDSDPDD